ncbi:site-specific DNA-methyltransferase, partial [Streptococcus uberis]
SDPMLGEYLPSQKVRWAVLLRSGADTQREDSKNLFYSILIDPEKHKVIKAGCPLLPLSEHPTIGEKIDGYEVAWPIRTDLSEGRWMVSADTLNRLIDKGYVSLGGFDKKRNTWAITYLSEKSRRQIDSGDIIIEGRDEETGVVKVKYTGDKNQEVRTVWNRALHNAGTYGSDILTNTIGSARSFSF